jgi:DNA-binding NarL/FixJ family response regulator
MRILIADDNEMVRSRLARILSSVANWEVCGQATDGNQAIQTAEELLPDLILLDISMPGLSGLETARLLQRKVPMAKILIMTQHDPIPFLPAALEAGAHACVEKSHLGTELLALIKNIMESSEALQIAAAGLDRNPSVRSLGAASATTSFGLRVPGDVVRAIL